MNETALIVGALLLIGLLMLIVALIPSTARAFGDEETANKTKEKLKKMTRKETEDEDWILGPIGNTSVDGIGEPLWDEDK